MKRAPVMSPLAFDTVILSGAKNLSRDWRKSSEGPFAALRVTNKLAHCASSKLKACVVATLALLALIGVSAAAEQAALEMLPADEAQVSSSGVAAPAGPGTLLVFGRFDDPAFAIADPSQITVVDANGKQLPLLIEEQSLFRDLGQIVSMRFLFVLPESELAAGDLQLKWGPDVRAENVVGEQIALAPVARERLRQFRWSRDSSGAGPSSDATIVVIADSNAGWYFLWYLLPISVVFALLTIRKIRARHSTD